MKKLLATTAILVLSTSTHAATWEVLPATNGDYKADIAVAVIAGTSDFDDADFSPKGLEVSLICPVLKPPKNTIRQQISYTESDKNGVDLKSVEVNPHYMVNVSEKLSVGAGPSLGVTKIETLGQDESVFTYGIGASARLNVTNNVFIGAETRYAWSEDADLLGETDDIDNLRTTLKIGFQF